MFERRALERIEISQHALLHVDGIRGCHPCLVVNFHPDGAMLHSSTHHTAAFRFDLSLDGFQNYKALSGSVAKREYVWRRICRSILAKPPLEGWSTTLLNAGCARFFTLLQRSDRSAR